MDKQLRLFTVHSRTDSCTLLSVNMEIEIVPMTLRPKTQNEVLGRSAGVPCEVVSGLRSHGFEATVQDSEAETMSFRSHGFEAMEDDSRKKNHVAVPTWF